MLENPTSEHKRVQILNSWPLIAVILVSLVMAFVIACSEHYNLIRWMHNFMGLFLCQLALLKLFHPKDFAIAFQKYDFISRYVPFYAYVYPFIELGLGLFYLSFLLPILVYILTILILGIGAVGVIQALIKKSDMHCACMGTVIKIPLSVITLIEDLGMVGMALWMLITKIF